MAFKRSFPEDGLYWLYKGQAEFVKYANEHLRKFIQEYVAREHGRKRKKKPTSPAKRKPKADAMSGEFFTIKVARKAALTLPQRPLTLLRLKKGDCLEVRVINHRIVSGGYLKISRAMPRL